jgi:hypothetical protein
MKMHKLSFLTLSALFLLTWSAVAGGVSTNKWVLTFTAVCRSTNDLGRIVPSPLSSRLLVASHTNDVRGHVLVYDR